jgi:hypothetical protein
VGHVDMPGSARDVAVSGDYAYIADYIDGLRIISIADPAHPTKVGFLGATPLVCGVAVEGDYVYYVAGASGLRVASVTDPAIPTLVGSYDTRDQAYGVTVSNGYVYVAESDSGLGIYQFYGAGVEENPRPSRLASRKPAATLAGSLPAGAAAFDAMGRRVVNPRSGVFFVRDEPQAASFKPQAVRKVILQR